MMTTDNSTSTGSIQPPFQDAANSPLASISAPSGEQATENPPSTLPVTLSQALAGSSLLADKISCGSLLAAISETGWHGRQFSEPEAVEVARSAAQFYPSNPHEAALAVRTMFTLSADFGLPVPQSTDIVLAQRKHGTPPAVMVDWLARFVEATYSEGIPHDRVLTEEERKDIVTSQPPEILAEMLQAVVKLADAVRELAVLNEGYRQVPRGCRDPKNQGKAEFATISILQALQLYAHYHDVDTTVGCIEAIYSVEKPGWCHDEEVVPKGAGLVFIRRYNRVIAALIENGCSDFDVEEFIAGEDI